MRVYLRDRLEDVIPLIESPLLILRGRENRILSEGWARTLAAAARDGRFAEMPGAHRFPWAEPEAWSEPVRRLALEVGA